MKFLAFFIDTVTKRPQFAEQVGGTSQMSKIRRQNVHTSLKSRLDIANVLGKSPVTKRPHVAKQPAGRHKWVRKCCDKPSIFCFRKGWTWCHRAFWGGWTLCHKWQTVHLEGGVDEKYVEGSYRWTIVTIVNCHSRRFVGWTLSLGRNVAWSVCGWTDRQGTPFSSLYPHALTKEICVIVLLTNQKIELVVLSGFQCWR